MSNIIVAAPANPVLSGTLTEAQVVSFTVLVGGIPAGKSVKTLVIQVQADGSGRIQVQTADTATTAASPVVVSA